MDGARMYLGASAFEAGETVWFAGPAGAGKTTMAKEYAALTGRGFVRIGFNHSTEMIDLIGQPEPQPANENGGVKMVWRDGVFTRAIRRAGTVILLDELTGAPPGTSHGVSDYPGRAAVDPSDWRSGELRRRRCSRDRRQHGRLWRRKRRVRRHASRQWRASRSGPRVSSRSIT